MPEATRQRLARLVRAPDPDLAEAALLVCAEAVPDLDVDAQLLRVDALADGLSTSGFVSAGPGHDARAVGAYLHGKLGFDGDRQDYYHPRNALLTAVLDRRRGLPITLSILYVAVARRVGVHAHGIGLPGHFVAGFGPPGSPVVVDPFNGGRVLERDDMVELVRSATGGLVHFSPDLLQPAPPAAVVRRLLENLTRDYAGRGELRSALWTVELKALVAPQPGDERERGELLLHLGRFREAAAAFERYVELAPDADDAEEVRRMARDALARTN